MNMSIVGADQVSKISLLAVNRDCIKPPVRTSFT
jgi:hypothetical protein